MPSFDQQEKKFDPEAVWRKPIQFRLALIREACQFRRLQIYMTKTKSVETLKLHEKDTGSADVQIALLTERINSLTGHLKSNAKDHSSRRGLLKMVARRRRLLDYLKRTSGERYNVVLEALQLRK